MLNCHCRDCQRATGSGCAPIVVVPRDAVEVRGELRYHALVGGSGKLIERGFCPACGSPVAFRLERVPGIVGLLAGSLDDPSLHKPTVDLLTASAQHWDLMAPDTQKLEQGLTR
jgi:hypothetical protein